MSEENTPVTAAHFRYLGERTCGEDLFLGDLKAAAVAEGMPPIWIGPEQASFMQILLKLCEARQVIEIGTLAGYSAIALARALPSGGRVRTIEIDETRAAFAERWIAQSDVADRIEVHRGAAVAVLATFADDSADAAFIDADKENYGRYLDECLRIVRSGGLIMIDNAFAFGQLFEAHPTRPDVEAVRRFNDQMAAERRLRSIIVPMGDGLWVGVTV